MLELKGISKIDAQPFFFARLLQEILLLVRAFGSRESYIKVVLVDKKVSQLCM